MTIRARKSIASITYSIPLRKTAAGTIFNITFPFLNNEEYIRVWYRNSEQEKKELILDTDYSIELQEGTNDIYGILILVKDIEGIENLTIERKIENDQDVNFTTDTLFSSTTEYALDKVTALVQDMNFKNYVLRAPSDEKLENSEVYELPSREKRVNKILGFGNDGLPRIYDRVEGGVIYPATRTSLGTIMVGDTLDVNDVGKVEVPYAGESRPGIVKVGEGFILAEEGKISVDKTEINDAKATANDAKTIAQNSLTEAQKSLLSAENALANCNKTMDKATKFSNSGWPYSDFPDVENWSFYTFPNSIYSYYVFFDGNKFIALGHNTDKAAYSYDGINWTASTLPSSSDWRGMCVKPGLIRKEYVAVASGTSTAAYSSDGINWTTITLPSSSNWYSVCYGGGKFVAVSYNSNIAAYSYDGINWTNTNELPGSSSWTSVCYGNGKFVAVGYNTDKAAYSSDGITWKAGTLPSSTNWRCMCYGGGKFVAATWNTSTVAYSTDGITWMAGTLPSSGGWRSICYGGEKYVAVAYNSNTAAYSYDGITWETCRLPSASDWYSVCYGDNKYVAVSGNNYRGAVAIGSIENVLTRILQKIG